MTSFCPLLISTQSVTFWYTDFHTRMYFVNQRNYKTLAMQAHTLTHTRYFYSLNVIISHLVLYKEGLGYLSVRAIASRSSSPSHVCICNGHSGSELCCVHCKGTLTSSAASVIICLGCSWRGDGKSPATCHGGKWGERRYSPYSFLTSALDGGEWSASRPGRALPPVPIG
jgi:hypothetical protein